MTLDDDQARAVSALYGPVCIIAGPGSGKTRVLVERTVRLIASGVAPESILTITFTNKAAREMRERLEARLGKHEKLPFIGTFHALGYEILKNHGERVGIQKDFAVLEKKKNPKETEIFSLDFDTLLISTQKLLAEHSDVRELYQNRFEFVMVDEYQDTDAVQAAILDILAGQHGNLCIIGDPNQAIYSFRGADPEHFRTFTKRYPQAIMIRLERNYRSTPVIQTGARGLLIELQDIQNAAENSEESAVQAPITICDAHSDMAEARWIIREIETLIGGSDYATLTTENQKKEYSFGDIAIIYRLHTIGQTLERSFATAGIPHRIIGNVGFFERPEIRDMLSRLKKNSWKSDFQEFQLTGAIRAIFEQIDVKSLHETKRGRIFEFLTFAERFNHLPFKEAQTALLEYAALARPEDDEIRSDAVTLITAHAAKGLEFPVVFIAGAEEGLFPYEKTMQGHRMSQRTSDVQSDTPQQNNQSDEERRLFYVAMTRAKERLYISHARERMLFGKTRTAEPSHFLADLPGELCKHHVLHPPKNKPAPPQARLF